MKNPTTTEREYGWEHQRERRKVERTVKAGAAVCVRCGLFIHPDEAWDLDHGDVKVAGQYAGPAHARCNRSAGARVRSQKQRGLSWSREW